MKKTVWLIITFILFIPASLVFAKGDFTYLTVKGPGITGELTITAPELTGDFFAFADFSKGAVEAPADPGEGYQIVRIYVVENKEQAFDSLYYYPYTGFVYYTGVADGSSEYDKQWYVANPAAGEPFRAALAQRAQLTWIPLAALLVLMAAFFIAYNRRGKSKVDDGS